MYGEGLGWRVSSVQSKNVMVFNRSEKSILCTTSHFLKVFSVLLLFLMFKMVLYALENPMCALRCVTEFNPVLHLKQFRGRFD